MPKKEEPKKPQFHATLDLHVNLWVPLPDATSMKEAVEQALAIKARELWDGDVKVDDVWDTNVRVSCIDGGSVELK